MSDFQVLIKRLDPDLPLPKYSKGGDAGADIVSRIDITLAPGERAASTSNRNFEGRQGRGGRTHLVSPEVAAATAVAGHFATPGDLA